MALLKSIATIGGWTMLSRILGFTRDLLIANVMGAGMASDAFFMAFKFPNLFRRLFGEGAMNAAFVPLYARKLEEEGIIAAKEFASHIASILLTFMAIFTILSIWGMEWIMSMVARGFLENQAKFDLTVALSQITFSYLLFMVIAAVLSGMLNSHAKFWAAAAAPIILNIILITSLLLAFFDIIALPEYGLAYGVLLAGLLQFLFLCWACYDSDIMVRLWQPRLNKDVKHMLVLMAPGVLGAGVVQINILVGDFLASHMGDGAVSYLYYADRVNQLPLGVIGVAVGVALLPLLTRQLRAGDNDAAMNSCNRSMEISLLLTLPATAALIAMPLPIISVLFERGSFSSNDAIMTANALRAYAIGLPAYILIKTVIPSFFAREDTKTPVKIAALIVIFNIILAVILMQFLSHVGIALATAISSWINLFLLIIILSKRKYYKMDAKLSHSLPRIVIASLIIGISLWVVSHWLSYLITGGTLLSLMILLMMVIGAILLYFALLQAIGGAGLKQIKSMLR